MEFPHLSRAPIVEGLVDIKVKPRADLSLDDLNRLRGSLKAKYPESKDLQTVQAQFKLVHGKSPSQSVATTLIGYRLERKDVPFVLLLRRDGVTISRLKPYEDWHDLVTEAKPIWERYLQTCRPELVTRVATRYINRIELQLEGLNFDDYLAAPPRFPKALPEILSEFLIRLVVPDAETGASIAITQALEPPNLENKSISVLLDIDVFKSVELDCGSKEIWKLLAAFRDLKNRAFFGSLTDKTLELLK